MIFAAMSTVTAVFENIILGSETTKFGFIQKKEAKEKIDEKELNIISKLIHDGQIIIFPTETVYGLAGVAFNETALAKIFEAKKRPTFDPLILHIASLEDVEKIATVFPEKAKKLAEKYWPGPLTLVLPKKESISSILTFIVLPGAT